MAGDVESFRPGSVMIPSNCRFGKCSTRGDAEPAFRLLSRIRLTFGLATLSSCKNSPTAAGNIKS